MRGIWSPDPVGLLRFSDFASLVGTDPYGPTSGTTYGSTERVMFTDPPLGGCVDWRKAPTIKVIGECKRSIYGSQEIYHVYLMQWIAWF